MPGSALRSLLLSFTLLMLPLVSGCLLLAAAGVGAAGAATYYYLHGAVCQDYPVPMKESWVAVKAALQEGGFPVLEEFPGAVSATITSQTGDGYKITVQLEERSAQVPAEGRYSQVCIRVGTFGDEDLSQRLLDRVGFLLLSPPGTIKPGNLKPVPQPAGPGPLRPRPVTGGPNPVPGGAETAEPPPLAPEGK